MVNGTNFEFEEYSQLTVRFTRKRRQLLGSGTLYVNGKDALVLTAAHVIWEKKTDELCLSIRLKDLQDKFLTIQELHVHKDYVHDPDGNNTENDAAILVVTWEEWMKDLISFKLKDPKVQNNPDQILYGYPGSKAVEEEEGRTSLTGRISDISSFWYSELEYNYKSGTNQTSRSAYMQGFSGGAVYQVTRNELIYSGAMSGGSGAETAGNKAKITRASLFLQLIEDNNLLHLSEIQLKDYIEENVKQISFFREDAIVFYRSSMEDLIDEGKIKADDFLVDGEDHFKTLACQYGHRNCPKYWQGQLTCAVCVYSILEEHDVDFRNLIIHLDDDRTVHALVLCTEEPIESLYHEMLEKGYFSDDGIIANDTLLLWANPKDNVYQADFPKKYGQNIVKSIITKESSLRKTISKNRFKEIDIVKGKYDKFNVGILGLGNVNRVVIDKADGDFDSMKAALLNLIKEVL